MSCRAIVIPVSPTVLIRGVLLRTARRKKKRGKGKGESSDKSDSDDVEVIKEWNTSSRGGNPEGRNRAEPVEEGQFRSMYSILGLGFPGQRVLPYKSVEPS